MHEKSFWKTIVVCNAKRRRSHFVSLVDYSGVRLHENFFSAKVKNLQKIILKSRVKYILNYNERKLHSPRTGGVWKVIDVICFEFARLNLNISVRFQMQFMCFYSLFSFCVSQKLTFEDLRTCLIRTVKSRDFLSILRCVCCNVVIVVIVLPVSINVYYNVSTATSYICTV